jgi:hypothetical protein
MIVLVFETDNLNKFYLFFGRQIKIEWIEKEDLVWIDRSYYGRNKKQKQNWEKLTPRVKIFVSVFSKVKNISFDVFHPKCF